MLEIGSLVDNKYKILREIGHGGMSTVYMAINERANRMWAIKEVRKRETVNFESVKQGLVAEINMLKKLRHPNLPAIIDVIEEDESFLIVMDYVEGNSLSKLLAKHKVIPQEYVISWAKQLCDTLVYLHTQVPPIIYRDMKPGNIMLKPDGNLILIDFGTAREFKENNVQDTICLGTLGYAAPEQFGGQKQTDIRTDIYGLGATIYHLLTGCNPAKPPYEIKPICQINPSLSVGLEHIIEKCTQKNPDDRYQSAAELLYALEHYEEMDDNYRKKQKVKLLYFIVLIVLGMAMAAAGFMCDYVSKRNAEYLYENMLEEASKTLDWTEKLEIYEKCIEIPGKAGEADAYLALMKTYKENDMVFDIEEANQLTKYININKKELQKNVENYREICFQMGKLYWYYFADVDGVENHVVRAKYSVEWFEDVLHYSTKDDENWTMAQVYAEIGTFYRDVTMNLVEANDKGTYLLLYKNMKTLLETVAVDDNESEIVRLELLEFARNTIWQYAAKFRDDGIKKEELLGMLEVICEAVVTTETTTEVTSKKKENIILFLDSAEGMVRGAFR